MTRLRPHLPALAAAAFGGTLFFLCSGPHVLSPTSIHWLLRGDWAQHYLGWAFARGAPPSLPVGRLDALLAPLGTHAAFTDSFPLLVGLLRPLSPLLPDDFQYLGAWLALCFALQGFVGARLGALLSPDRRAQFLVGALLAAAPPLLWRVNHEALASHWLLLGLLGLNLAPANRPGWRPLLAAAGLVVLAASINPYLAAMSVALSEALVLRLVFSERRLGALRGLGWGVGLVAAALGTFWLFGFLDASGPATSWGFGHFSADLLAPVNPMGFSRVLPELPTNPGQNEGFAYFGLGMLALGALAAALAVRAREAVRALPWRRVTPVLLVCVAMAIYALSSVVTAGGVKVLSARRLWSVLEPVTGALRSSGRFVWPLFYLCCLGAMALVLRLSPRPRLALAGLAAALALQLGDLRFEDIHARFREVPVEGFGPDTVRLLRDSGRRLVLYPPFTYAGGEGCPAAHYSHDAWVPFAHLAQRAGVTINSAYLARVPEGRFVTYCRELRAAVESGRFDAETVYVPHPEFRPAFDRPELVCGELEGSRFCVRADRASPLRDALAGLAAPGKAP